MSLSWGAMDRIKRVSGFGLLRAHLGRLRALGVVDNDFLLASYPKSGNTWLKAMLVTALLGRDLDLDKIEALVPYVGFKRAGVSLSPALKGSVFKTHEQYSDRYRRGILLIRNFEDVAMSYLRAIARGQGGLNTDQLIEEIPSVFMPFSGTSVDWAVHTEGWIKNVGADSNWILVNYDTLREQPRTVVERILTFIGAPVEERFIDLAVETTSPVALRVKEMKSSRLRSKKAESGISFFVDKHEFEDVVRDELRRKIRVAPLRFERAFGIFDQVCSI